MATTQTLTHETQAVQSEYCLCGAPDCLGHEVIDGQFVFPGFTSEAVLQRSKHKVIAFNCHVTEAFAS